MLERRPVWGLILLLNVCVVIWRISVQEPALLDAEVVGGYVDHAQTNSNTNANINTNLEIVTDTDGNYNNLLVNPVQQSWQKHFAAYNNVDEQNQQLYAGKHLLAESAETNDISNKVPQKAEDSLRINIHTRSSSSIRSTTSTSSSSFVSSRKHNHRHSSSNFNKQQVLTLNPYTASSTPETLVTAATLRNAADVQRPTTTKLTATSIGMSLDLPPNDLHQLIDLHDFKYLMQQPGCSADIQALILVHSAPGNIEKRQLIRDTWGNMEALPRIHGKMPFRVIFLLGAVATDAQQLELERENFQYEDMVQGPFFDNYRNMTYKHVMALKWFLYNCEHVQLLIKVDDDVYVNTPQLLIYYQWTVDGEEETAAKADATVIARANATAKVIATDAAVLMRTADNDSLAVNHQKSVLSNNNFTENSTYTSQFNASKALFRHPRDLIFCESSVEAKVKRTFRSKWRVSGKEYSGRYYPPYCPGYAIFYSTDVVLKLYKAAQVTKYFWIDDVHITGILAQKVQLNITRSRPYILDHKTCDKLLSGKLQSSDVEFIYAWHLISPIQMHALWKLYLKMVTQYFARTSYLHLSQKNTNSLIKLTESKSFYR